MSFAARFSIRASALVCTAAAFLSGDTLTLRTGETIQGTYLGGTTRQVRMDLNGEIRTFDIAQVQSVIFADPVYHPAPTYSPAPANSSAPRGSAYPPPAPYPPAAQAPYPPAAPNAPIAAQTAGITIPADTPVTIRMIDPVDSETARLGQTYRASIDEPVLVNGQEVIPRGADVVTKLVEAQQSGKIQGRAVLTLALSTITVNGQQVNVTSSDVRTESNSRGARSGAVIGGTAALGAIIGAIAGGGKGAAIGATSGAAAGTGVQVLTAGQKIKVPSETRLTFNLQNPVQL
jgi:hypothetical protein